MKPDHSNLLTVMPKKGMTAKQEEELAKQLEEKKNTLTAQQIDTIIAETKHLREYQEMPSTPEQLASIPLLAREDE